MAGDRAKVGRAWRRVDDAPEITAQKWLSWPDATLPRIPNANIRTQTAFQTEGTMIPADANRNP
jgi:hypothetical protein